MLDLGDQAGCHDSVVVGKTILFQLALQRSGTFSR
jgi:hypothetical protein